MNILIVGNVIKDVYLNLDSRTEHFEKDRTGTAWLDFSFNSSSHHFFHRSSNFGGAAITSEVLSNLGLNATITNYTPDAPISPEAHRYILVADDGVSYLSPSSPTPTLFTPPETPLDYIYIDRSAALNTQEIEKISSYLAQNSTTKIIVYITSRNQEALSSLAPKTSLIFAEKTSALQSAPPTNYPSNIVVNISPSSISYRDISEDISVDRIDTLTHLSVFSILSATILAGFIQGYSVEKSLRLAKINAENSTLSSTLSLTELETIHSSSTEDNLELIAATLVRPPKGILAADESGGSIQKKFATLNIPDTYENRHDYRNLFFTAPDIEQHLNGIILFDETARDHMNTGEPIPDFLISHQIVPGIKVDQGLEPFTDNPDETYTKGLDGLAERLREYYQMGIRFAKWRAAFNLTLSENGEIITPTDHAITENSRILAEYAKICQSAGLVPIVEPELVYDDNYSIENSAAITGHILDTLFSTLKDFGINLRACILKVNMVLAGKKFHTQSIPEEVGHTTAKVLKNHVPSELAGIVFLSGGQTPEQATANLTAVLQNGPFPWPITFSFARALQDPALFAWQDDNSNAETAKKAFLERLITNTDSLKK